MCPHPTKRVGPPPIIGTVISSTTCPRLRPRQCFRANYKYPAERSQTALIEHEAIVAAINNRDGELAERLMRDHVVSSCDFALAQFETGTT